MRFRLDGGMSGDERYVTVRITGTETDFCHLIDALSVAEGSAQVLAGKLAEHTGLVDVPPDEMTDMARMLEYYANLLRHKAAES